MKTVAHLSIKAFAAAVAVFGFTLAAATPATAAPPRIGKSFAAASVALGGSVNMTFVVTNAGDTALTGLSFTDALPAGLTAPNGTTSTCGGSLAITGSGVLTFTGGTLAGGTICTITVTVTGAAAGVQNNATGAISSTETGVGSVSNTATVTVVAPPTITKAFGAASIPLNGSTSLTITITNPNVGTTLTGVSFTDTLPAGLVVATPSGLSSTCGGTATAVPGAGSLSLSGGTLAPSASCTFALNVTGTTAGVKNNSVQVTSTEGGTGNTSNASITVVAPPVIIKAFGAASVPVSGSTSLTFTIQNNNTTTTLTGVGFTDAFPAGLVVATPNGLTGSCGGGTITATAASSVVSLTGSTLAASTSCTFAVNVTGTTAGTKNNTTGNVTSTEGGTGGTASASLGGQESPAITSPASAAFTIGVPGSFTVTTTGFPAPAITMTGTLPSGVTFVDNGNGTGTLSGTPGAAGSFPLTFTATNGVDPSATQAFTLTVGAAAAASQNVPALGPVALAILVAVLALAGAYAGRRPLA